MPQEFRMPDIGEGLTEAEIITWFVTVGDSVEIDQVLVEVETAKTVVEIPSPYAGTITSITVLEGGTINVGDVLFVIGGDAPDEPVRATGSTALPDAPRAEEERGPPIAPSATGATPRAMPVVRKLAKDLGIDLATVTGSGPGGAITRADLKSAPADAERSEVVPLSSTRRAIADHMAESWRTIPHVTVQEEIRAEQLMEAGASVPIEVLVSQVVIPLLRAYPEFNSEYVEGGMISKPAIHMGFAVDTDAGLMVVVVREADALSMDELALEFRRLADAAQNRTITHGEVTGQTFTISNVGALGGGHGTPIIPLGTSSILSIGRAKHQPVVEDEELGVGLVAPIDLSYDHRLIDGGLGQRFLADLVDGLESPGTLA